MHKKSHLEERLSACSDILTLADLTDKLARIDAQLAELS